MHKYLAGQPNWGTSRFCAVTLRGEDPDGWINTQHVLTGTDPAVWISMHGAREVAKLIEWTSPEARAELIAENTKLQAELDQAVAEISELRKFKEQVDAITAGKDFQVVRKGGAPSKQTRPENIKQELEDAVTPPKKPESGPWGKQYRGKELKSRG